MAPGGDMSVTRRVVLTGVESTGKSTLAPQLTAHFGGVLMPEYGRSWAERNGTDFSIAALRAIAAGHIAASQELSAGQPHLIIEDTDVVMTSAWSIMLHGRRDPLLSAMPATGDLYLLFRPDTPWIDDGTRMFGGDERTRFHNVVRDELDIRRITPVVIAGDWAARRAKAITAIETLLATPTRA